MRSIYFIFCFLVFVSCEEDLPLDADMQNSCANGHVKYEQVVLLVIGQSNAANFGSELYQAQCSATYNFYQGNLFPLHDPLKGANGLGGSPWARLGDILIKQNFTNELIIASVAVGGTSIEQWIPGGNLNGLIFETVNDLQQNGLTITHVLWHQGESNNTELNPSLSPQQNAADYAYNLDLLINYIRSLNVHAPFFPATATRCGSMQIDWELQDAQQSLSSDSLGVYNGPNTDILGMEYRYDGCHFNGEGLNAHALLWADILLQH